MSTGVATPTRSIPSPASGLRTEADPDVGYGGRQLRPAHYEPDRVPHEVARYSGMPDTLATGSPGKVGLLGVEFARRGRGTELVGQYQKWPLQIIHPLYDDQARPDLPYTYLMSTEATTAAWRALRRRLTGREDPIIRAAQSAASPAHWFFGWLFTLPALAQFNLPSTTAPFCTVAGIVYAVTTSLHESGSDQHVPDGTGESLLRSLLANVSEVVLVNSVWAGALSAGTTTEEVPACASRWTTSG